MPATEEARTTRPTGATRTTLPPDPGPFLYHQNHPDGACWLRRWDLAVVACGDEYTGPPCRRPPNVPDGTWNAYFRGRLS